VALPVPPDGKAAIGRGPLRSFAFRLRASSPRCGRFAATFEVPRARYLFELRVSDWLHMRPPRTRDRRFEPYTDEEVRVARHLATLLRVPWVEPPAYLLRDLVTQARWLGGAQLGGRRGIRIWLRQAEELPRSDRRWRRRLLMQRRMREWEQASTEKRRVSPEECDGHD
jgi:hypothetical protein